MYRLLPRYMIQSVTVNLRLTLLFFGPVPVNDSTQLGDLGNVATMIIWPKPLPGLADLTPSPFLDKLERQEVELKRIKEELKQKTSELNEVRSKLRMFEERESSHQAEQGEAQKKVIQVSTHNGALLYMLTGFVRVLDRSSISCCW